MSALAKTELTDSDIQVLAQAGVIPPNTPPAQVKLFAIACQKHGLDPFKKEIYLTGYKKRDSNEVMYSVIVGIDGVRNKAQRTKQHAGLDDAKFNLQSDGQFQTAAELKAANKLPISCTVTVYRVVAGQRCPFTHTAVFSEFSSGQQKWATMPFQMIQKCAESFALKKAFGDELSGLHIEEEMAAFEGNTIEVKQKPKTLPELDQTHEKWDDVATALRLGQCDINYVRTRFTLSDENEKLLLQEVAAK